MTHWEHTKKQLIINDTKSLKVWHLLDKTNTSYFPKMVEFIKKVTRTHGAENVMVVVTNRGAVYQRLLKLKRKREISKDIQLTYFRSASTIGVSSERRVILNICAPFPA